MRDLKINAQVCIYFLTDLNIGYCVELTFLEDELGRSFLLTSLKCSFSNLLHFESESESRLNSDKNCF